MNLYLIRNDKLLTHTIINEHNMCEGASVETYLVRDEKGQKYVCSKDDWGFLTAKEAWEDYIECYDQQIESNEEMIESLNVEIVDAYKKIKHAKQQLAELNQ